MFERYTERARRTIFFSRYEAVQLGSPYIETEHLLLGVLRESKDILRLFGDQVGTVEDIRNHIEKTYRFGTKASMSMDLPLSNESKRVLAYGAEESERMHHKHIGTEHLLLGLLRETNCAAATMLNERGITLEEARDQIAATVDKQGLISPGIEKIHRRAGRREYLSSKVAGYKNFAWQKQAWKPRDILVDKQIGRVMFYAGQAYDESKYQLVAGGWKRDHCAVCNWPLYEDNDPEHSIAYTNGRDWVCTECYDKFLAPPVTPLDDFYT